jgi:prolyl-tRNA synthetase
VLPPRLAPVKAVLVPIYRKDDERARVLEAAHRIAREIGAKVDDREGQSPGAKFFHWERRGVPVVLELGPRDLASGNIVLKRRDTGTKEIVPQTEIAARLPATLDGMQKDLYNAAKQRLRDNTVTGRFPRRSGSHSGRRHGGEGRRQVRHGPFERRPGLRCAPQGI